MEILIAEDDPVSRIILETKLIHWGYDVVVAANGAEAWTVMQNEVAPSLAILDWMMPEIDGIEVCRRIRQIESQTPPYIIILTTKNRKEDVVEGLNAGANDYLTKPFDFNELRARLQVGVTVIDLQKKLSEQIKELEIALAQVKQLQGILPICSYCKNIRNDQNYWERVENYISHHSDAKFSHGICPSCYDGVVQSQIEKLKKFRENQTTQNNSP
jgi:CheY-like chemotaxis protein